MRNGIRLERNPFKIIWYCKCNILYASTFLVWFSTIIFTLVIEIASFLNPDIIHITDDNILEFAVEGLGILLAIMSIWTYSTEELAKLFLATTSSKKITSKIPNKCPQHIKEHFVYYSLLAEYFLAIILWALICAVYEIKTTITFDGSSLSNSVITIFFRIFYVSLTNLLILIIVEIFIKSVHRLTNKVILEILQQNNTKQE